RTGAAAYQADAGPQIRADFQLVAPTAVQRSHAALTFRVHLGERFLRLFDGLVVELADQFVRSAPGCFIGFAHDDVEADAETQFAAGLFCTGAHLGDFFRHGCRGFAPGQIDVNLLCRQVDGFVRRAAEVQRRVWRLDRRID